MNKVDDTLFEIYARRYKRMLWKFANSVKATHLSAEDYYVMCLGTLHKCMQEFDKQRNTKFSSYLYTSLRYRMMSEYDKAKKDLNEVSEFYGVSEDLQPSIFEFQADSNDLPDTIALAEDIRKELLKIPHGEDSLDIILNGTSYTDLGIKHNITHTAVMRRHNKVLKALRKKFEVD